MQFSSLGIRPGTERMSRLLSALGSPHLSAKAIQVLGTNGKGSTAATIESILRASGARTAIYTSPHLAHLGERLRIAGEIPPAEIWESAFDALRLAVRGDPELDALRPTFFESLTAMAYWIIDSLDVEIAVIEAGMGGRYDATSLCDRAASIVTPIGMDHMQYLGDTLEKIAMEKFAASARGAHAFYAGDTPELIPLFMSTAQEAGATPHILDQIARPSDILVTMDGTTFDLRGFGRLHTPLIGTHQAQNVGRAVLAMDILRASGALPVKISDESLRSGISSTVWRGRFDVCDPGDGLPRYVLDGAHNAHAMKALVSAVREIGSDSGAHPSAILFAVMSDKDIEPMLREMRKIDAPVFVTSPDMDRAKDPGELAAMVEAAGMTVAGVGKDSREMLRQARSHSGDGYVLCCGSLFLVGELLEEDEI